jgi:hypothetical protein
MSPSAALGLPSGTLICQGKIDLAFEWIYPRDEDAQRVTHRESVARLAADQAPLGRVKHVEIVTEGRDVN